LFCPQIIITDPKATKPVAPKHDNDISKDEWTIVQEKTKAFSK